MNTRQWMFSAIALALQIPYFAYAAGLVPCGGDDEPICQTCHALQLINGVAAWLVGILSIAAAVMFVIAGFRIVTAQGNPSVLQAAKSMIMNVAIGFVIVLAAWILVDLLMRSLLGGGGNTSIGPWNRIQCVEQPVAFVDSDEVQLSGGSIGMAGGTVQEELCALTPGGNTDCSALEAACSDGGGTPTVVTTDPQNYRVSCAYQPPAFNSASCSLVTDASNPCHESNLGMFGARAAEASIICNKESGGAPVRSGSDLCCGPGGNCSGAPSFSGGYFQINVLAHANRIPGCTPGAFYERNGTAGPQGDCVRRNSEGICTGWSCTITNRAMYNECMRVTTDSALNFEIAEQLYNGRGQRFNDWSWSARRCGISY